MYISIHMLNSLDINLNKWNYVYVVVTELCIQQMAFSQVLVDKRTCSQKHIFKAMLMVWTLEVFLLCSSLNVIIKEAQAPCLVWVRVRGQVFEVKSHVKISIVCRRAKQTDSL